MHRNTQQILGFLGKGTGFDVYSKKQQWKLYLLVFATVIVAASFYYTDVLVRKIASDERQRVELWADAIRKRETLLRDSEILFNLIQAEERKRVELLTQVYDRLNRVELDRDALNFYTSVLQSNTTIPLVLTDENGEVISSSNLEPYLARYDRFTGELADYFSLYSPLSFSIIGGERYIYYQDSRVFTELRVVLDDLIDSFLFDVVVNAAHVPVIVVDGARRELIAHGNIQGYDLDNPDEIRQLISSMAQKDRFVPVHLPTYGQCFVYYTNSLLLTQLRFYPLVQFLAIGIFLFVAYMLFSTARKAEQNQVWVGMSKETAHQLGTPLSSLIAWVEYLRLKGIDESVVLEVNKDVKRLENITERFSKIGSNPSLHEASLRACMEEVVEYMKTRTPKKVAFKLAFPSEDVIVPINENLFGWVIENLIKNAIDAMDGAGIIYISVQDKGEQVFVDVSDDGKGIHPSRHKAIFNPGFTSKKSGWGLGLSLSRRIVEDHHKGRLFVKESAPNNGTTFRIILKKKL